MSTRKNTVILKRSNVIGKIPSNGDLLLGELAANTADAILYISGTTANSILPIGWDRVAKTGDTMTGTLYAPSVSATTISAQTGLIGQYIDFVTGNTDPTPIAGRVYYDQGENALSYYPATNNMDVTINIGQENVIKVRNLTGSLIPNGAACHIDGSNGDGTPIVILAIASATTDDSIVSGVATHDIPDGELGFITSFGIVRDLSITGVSEGTIIYLSDTTPGGFVYSMNDLAISSRTNKIGRLITTGITGATIYVDILNENVNLSLSDRQMTILNGNNSSTGVYQFSGATKISSTTFDVASANGWIVHNTYDDVLSPHIHSIDYSGQTGLTTPFLSGADSTYILLTSASTIMMQSTFPTPQQRRDNILLSKIVHPDRLSIQTINNLPDYDISPVSQLRDMFTPIRLINQGIYSTPYTGLTFQRTAGTLWGLGIGFVADQLNPDSVFISAATPASFFYRTQTGGTSSLVTNIDPTMYDVGGTITPISTVGDGNATRSTNQRIYQFPTGTIVVQYGQTVYNTLPEAISAAQFEPYVENTNNMTTGLLIGVLSIRRGATQLSATTDSRFLTVSKFGESVGSAAGISTATLQSTYDNSQNPEIVTNSTLDGFQIKGGTGNDNDKNLIIENNSGAETAWVKADGSSSFNTISATSISATTFFGLLNNDTYVTGGTYNNGTTTYTNNMGGTFNVTGFTTENFVYDIMTLL